MLPGLQLQIRRLVAVADIHDISPPSKCDFLAKNTQGWAFILVMFDPIQEIQRLGMDTLCEWVLWYLKTWELKRRRAYSRREFISKCLCTTTSRCNVYHTMYACGDNQIRVSLQST